MAVVFVTVHEVLCSDLAKFFKHKCKHNSLFASPHERKHHPQSELPNPKSHH
ncbi:hypothetical protein HMPREF0580_0412 [Mobiluncus mulieris ATCC 35239]|uniref:Uncharacterized protein n=1 Tax=Mobiluncus mulieris ATCC 35239 TaxID=871571 RepID=E0QNE8_9ACTO|nr:hypothetical protein HMPREF0580_0412 [Mobiluncus mulieris ATCC 35239]